MEKVLCYFYEIIFKSTCEAKTQLSTNESVHSSSVIL